MWLITVYEDSKGKGLLKAHVFSPPVLFLLFTWTVNTLLPLILMYQREGIWIKSNTLVTQPDVSFRHQFILTLEQSRSSPGILFYSTFPDLNLLMDPLLIRTPEISSYELDSNSDGKKDSLYLKLNLPIEWNEEIIGVNLYLFFHYKIKSIVNMDGNYLLAVNEFTSVPGSAIEITGDLKLQQKDLIRSRDFRYRSQLTDLELLLQERSHFSLAKLIEFSSRKNFSLVMSPDSTFLWSRARDNSQDDFSITFNLNYVTDTFYYRPGLWVVLKWATIQYMALFFLIYIAMKRLRQLAFTSGIFSLIDGNLLK